MGSGDLSPVGCGVKPHDLIDKKNFQSITESEAISESIILGLRLTSGIPEEIVPHHFAEKVQKLIGDGLLTRHDKNIALTPRGMDLANRVFSEFL